MSDTNDRDLVVGVRIRAASATESVPFTTSTIWRLGTLINMLPTWGLFADGEERTEFSGQFVVDSTGAYFEIVAHEPEDA